MLCFANLKGKPLWTRIDEYETEPREASTLQQDQYILCLSLQTELLLLWMLLMATVVATFIIQRYRYTAIPPSGAAMVLGILAGLAVKLAGKDALFAFVQQDCSFT